MISHYTSQILILNIGMCYLACTKDQGKRTLILFNDVNSTLLIDMPGLSLFRFLLFTLFLGGYLFEDVVYFRV